MEATKQAQTALKTVSHKPISLWDMTQYQLLDLIDALDRVKHFVNSRISEIIVPKSLHPQTKHQFFSVLEPLRIECEKLPLLLSRNELKAVVAEIESDQIRSEQAALARIRGILTCVHEEISKTCFGFLPLGGDEYFSKEKLFGESVQSAFPGARRDIKDAGNCLAASLNTAAVYHLMRVAEFGLRVAAQNLQISIIGKTTPIEFATWSNVLSEIDDRLKAEKISPRSEERETKLQFYSGVVQEIRTFQYAWRDPVMHVRTRFDEPEESMNVFRHIRRFMQSLAENGIKETT